MKKYRHLILFFTVALVSISASSAMALSTHDTSQLDADFSRLLSTYVQHNLVDYEAWSAHEEDAWALVRYVDQLTALDPEDWPQDAALAYWINLYNAVTLRLILDYYPLKSIKDIGGFLKKSPWKRELVTVAGRSLTLNNIENDIIRPQFNDPRIHFALNCASVGCPPLSNKAYSAEDLSDQLDAASKLALNRHHWVQFDGEVLRLTKIFDWYGGDFEKDGGSVVGFIRKYRTEALPETDLKIEFMPYDWSLNNVKK